MSSLAVIENNILNLVGDLAKLAASLQKEFEFFSSVINYNESTLKAKKRQIDDLNAIITGLKLGCEQIGNTITESDNELWKREACSVYHGVSFEQLMWFIDRPLKSVADDIRESFNANYFTVPEKLSHLVDHNKSEAAWLEKLENDLKVYERPGMPVMNIANMYKEMLNKKIK